MLDDNSSSQLYTDSNIVLGKYFPVHILLKEQPIALLSLLV